jgi:PKD repeat protein
MRKSLILFIVIFLIVAFGFTACGTTTNVPPEIAALVVSALLGFIGLPVTFTVEAEGIIEQYEWDFDNDGIASVY